MRKTDGLLYAVMTVGFTAIGWTAWSERAPEVPVKLPAPVVVSTPVAKPTKQPVAGRSRDPRPMYEYKVVRIPRLIHDEDDETRHNIMLTISYKLCYDFYPFFGFEALSGYSHYIDAQDYLNKRDATELGPDGLRIYVETFSAMCAWDDLMWEIATFKYSYGAHGPARPAAGARARSAEILSLILERITDESLAAAIKHPKVMPFTAAKAKIAKLMPEVPGPPEYPVTAQDYRDFEALKARLIVLTTKLGQAAAALPPEEQVRLSDHLWQQLTAFDQ
jgi:hypothetical protein